MSKEEVRDSFKAIDRYFDKKKYIHLWERNLNAPWLRILKGDDVEISHLRKLEKIIHPKRQLYYRTLAIKEIEEKRKKKFDPPPLPVYNNIYIYRRKREPHELIDNLRKMLYGLLLTRTKSKLMVGFEKFQEKDLPLKIRIYVPKVSISLNRSGIYNIFN